MASEPKQAFCMTPCQILREGYCKETEKVQQAKIKAVVSSVCERDDVADLPTPEKGKSGVTCKKIWRFCKK